MSMAFYKFEAMLIQFYAPEKLSPADLDHYLETGWFRNSVLLHNSKVICLDGDVHTILNIRLPLKNHQFSRSLRRIKKTNDSQFRFEIQRVQLTQAKEKLYQKHLERFKGFLFDSLDQFLFAYGKSSVFNTYEITVYDGDKLVAFSLFDIGENSMASLLGIYNTDYSKYSLGIYTMILEIEFAKKKNITYYYPGYVLDNSEEFDYKLRVGTMQYMNQAGFWVDKSELSENDFPGDAIKSKMQLVVKELEAEEVKHTLLLNPYYTIGYVQPFHDQFSKSTQVILMVNGKGKIGMIDYMFEEGEYQLAEVMEDPRHYKMVDMVVTEDLKDQSVYLSRVMSFTQIIERTNSVDELMLAVRNWYLH